MQEFGLDIDGDDDDHLADLLVNYDERLDGDRDPYRRSGASSPRFDEWRASRRRNAASIYYAGLATDQSTFGAEPTASRSRIRRQSLGRFHIRQTRPAGSASFICTIRNCREVALKVPRPDTLETRRCATDFCGKGGRRHNLDHPNVLAVHEAGEVGAFASSPRPIAADPTWQWLTKQTSCFGPARGALAS